MIYLDYQATTPLAPEAREAMLRWLDGPGGSGFGNPHSPHRLGRRAEAAVEVARERVAALFPPGGTVVFTSGATEALNLAWYETGNFYDEDLRQFLGLQSTGWEILNVIAVGSRTDAARSKADGGGSP